MTKFTLPYGRTQLTFNLPDSLPTTLLAPAVVPVATDPIQAVNLALDEPVGNKKLADFSTVQSAAIAINDKTRPVPHKYLLPPLLERLESLGLTPQAITLLIATGTHVPMPPEEFPQVVPPDILKRYPVISHDADDRENLLHLGQTKRGTPVWINRRFVQADLRVVVGNIEPHQFVGFSGGVKSAAIGLVGHETISHNHAMLTHPQSKLGHFDDNPIRQDIEEIGRIIGIHFALNAILNESKQIVVAIAGEPEAVMRQGIPQVRELYQINVPEPFDLLIVSSGGHPKDINLYQAQKGLGHAAPVVKKGGAIILAAACPEGIGSRKYEQWMEGMTSHQAVLERFQQEGFQVGPHKAFQIARDSSRARVLLVSQMPADLVRRLLLTPAGSLDQALSLALDNLAPKARVGVIPLANATIPTLKNNH